MVDRNKQLLTQLSAFLFATSHALFAWEASQTDLVHQLTTDNGRTHFQRESRLKEALFDARTLKSLGGWEWSSLFRQGVLLLGKKCRTGRLGSYKTRPESSGSPPLGRGGVTCGTTSTTGKASCGLPEVSGPSVKGGGEQSVSPQDGYGALRMTSRSCWLHSQQTHHHQSEPSNWNADTVNLGAFFCPRKTICVSSFEGLTIR